MKSCNITVAVSGGKDIVAKIVVFNSRAPHQKGVQRVKKLLFIFLRFHFFSSIFALCVGEEMCKNMAMQWR